MERIEKPWGFYEVLAEGDCYKVKRLVVRPGHRLSLQSHTHREERWTVARGFAHVTIGTELSNLTEGRTIFIGKSQRHRLANPGKIDLELIEVQWGNYLGEDDIVRYEDDYDRTPVPA